MIWADALAVFKIQKRKGYTLVNLEASVSMHNTDDAQASVVLIFD